MIAVTVMQVGTKSQTTSSYRNIDLHTIQNVRSLEHNPLCVRYTVLHIRYFLRICRKTEVNKYRDGWNLIFHSQQAYATYQILNSPEFFGKMKLASTLLPGLNHKTTLVVAIKCFRISIQENVSPSILQ